VKVPKKGGERGESRVEGRGNYSQSIYRDIWEAGEPFGKKIKSETRGAFKSII
jgi:hypothetical protein